MKYLCPICENGYIDITEERTGEPGFRMSDYDIVKKTCDCITSGTEDVVMAIMSYKNEKLIEKDICEKCDSEKATIHYPIRSWLGEYKDICTHCFEKEINKLKEMNSKDN